MLIYEATLVRNLTTRDLPLLQISGREVRQTLDLSRESFVDFALLLGSDFSERLHGLGPSNAIKLIQAQQSIEAILQSERKKSKGRRFLPEPKMSEAEYLKQVEAGRMVFNSLPLITDEIRDQITAGRLHDEEAVTEILRGFDLGYEARKGDWNAPFETDYFGDSHSEHNGSYAYV